MPDFKDYNHFLIQLLTLIVGVLLFACTLDKNNTGANDNPGKNENSGETSLAPSITVEANHISAISAILAGKANLGTTVAADLRVGFQYSKSAGILPSNSTTVEATDADADFNYTTGVTGLEPTITYFFRSFVRQNGQDTYGETKSFTTKEATSMLETKEASDIEATKATMNAKLDLTDVLQYKSLDYGFLWGSSEEDLNTDFKCAEIKEKSFSVILTNLSYRTQYWYKAYVKVDSQTYYGEVKTFTTDMVPVESVSLNEVGYTFNTLGNTLSLNASVLPADASDKSVEWSSDREDVATVNQNGTVKAVGNGSATITVTTKDQGKTARCAITVAQWITGISLDVSSITLNEGQEQTLTATINPDNANDKTVKWISSDESVATVDRNGKVTAVSKGTATITAEANDGSGEHISCSVTVKRPVSSIELNKTSIVIYNDKSENLTATVIPSSANDTSVTWSSPNSSVATVSSSGLVVGKTRGSTTITVTANDGSGVKASCEVEVRQHVTSITLSKTSLFLVIGAEKTISAASVLPANANDRTYTWSSSDSSIASVDQNGKITANAKGNTLIKATANDGSGVSASCEVSVCPVGAVDLGLSVYWATCNLSENGFVSSPETYGDYYAWGETRVKSYYSWSNYKFGNSVSGPFSKYNTNSSYGTVDNRTVLDESDDVAHVKLGDSWRIPTYAEWTELTTKCTWVWTTKNSVEGIRVTGPNGNSIFLPFAGKRYDSSLGDVGSEGEYWSSSLYTSYPYGALYFFCYSGGTGRSYGSRFYGFTVRPVSD